MPRYKAGGLADQLARFMDTGRLPPDIINELCDEVQSLQDMCSELTCKREAHDNMETEPAPKMLRVLASWPNRQECVCTYSPGFVAEQSGAAMSTVYKWRSGYRAVPLNVLSQLVSDVEPRVDIVEACGMVLMVEPA